jgi:kynurenine formamidase
MKLSLIASIAVAAMASVSWCTATPQAEPSLSDLYQILAKKRYVDLSHSTAPGIPHYKGFSDMTVRSIYTVAKDGFQVDEYCHVGQWGTHVDAPSHFHEGLKAIDGIEPSDLFLPLVVLDVHQKVRKNPDYVVSLADVAAWEKIHGRIPARAFVALRTDWSKKWPNQAAMQNKDAAGVAHYPGWSKEVLELLYVERGIAASGHETTDTDPGLATSKDDYSLESYVLGTNHYQIELLANLDQVPPAGALLMVGLPKVSAGSGFPTRVVAILP